MVSLPRQDFSEFALGYGEVYTNKDTQCLIRPDAAPLANPGDRVCAATVLGMIVAMASAIEVEPEFDGVFDAYLVPDSTNLVVVDAPKPDYPLEAALKRVQGQVVIRLHITTEGNVSGTEIVSGDPILAQAAAEAMKEWKFKTFIKGGKPVNVNYNMTFNYSLKGYFPNGCALYDAVTKSNAENVRARQAVHHQVEATVMGGRLIRRVDPEYPMIARERHLQGTVLLFAVIGKDGNVRDLQALCGDPALVAASLEAVRHWRYQPYVLNGEPVDVDTTIRVVFHM